MEPISDRDRMKEELKHEIMKSLQPVDLARLGLLFKPQAAEDAREVPGFAELGEHEHEGEGEDLHEHMLTFPMFLRDESGEIIEVDLASIHGDTSDYGPTGDDDKGGGGHNHGGHPHDHG